MRFDKLEAKWLRLNVKDASVQCFQYSFRDQNGNWNHEAEKCLARIESAAAEPLKKLDSSGTFTDADKNRIAMYICAMFRRPAALVNHFQSKTLDIANAKEEMHALIDSLEPEFCERYSPEEIEETRRAIADGQLDLSADTAKAMQMQVWMQSLPRNSEVIADLHWQVWRACKGHSFITSDAPVYFRKHGRYEDMAFVSIGDPSQNPELFFPISAKSFLIGTHRPARALHDASKNRVKELNALTIRMAYRYVFATETNPQLVHLAEVNRHFAPPFPNFDSMQQSYAKKMRGEE